MQIYAFDGKLITKFDITEIKLLYYFSRNKEPLIVSSTICNFFHYIDYQALSQK